MKVGSYNDRILTVIRQIQNFIDLESLEILQLNGYLDSDSITRVSKITLRTLEGIKLTIEINYVGLKIVEIAMPEAMGSQEGVDLERIPSLVGNTYDTMNTLLSFISPQYNVTKDKDNFHQESPTVCLDR